ncbi:MAG: DMT family transporter, partial [Pseudomonadota bacterium]|nr:DMT family transporter [Pseudomonadota bacterium]
LCMAFYSVWSRAVIRRSTPIAFTVVAMGAGALCLTAISLVRDGFAAAVNFGLPQWLAIGYLGIFGGAVGFFLWSYALSRTTPTRVAISVTVNPIAAAIIGATMLGEPIGWSLVVGLVTVFIGIWIATTASPSRTAAPVLP